MVRCRVLQVVFVLLRGGALAGFRSWVAENQVLNGDVTPSRLKKERTRPKISLKNSIIAGG
jgi:hypothetical protein